MHLIIITLVLFMFPSSGLGASSIEHWSVGNVIFSKQFALDIYSPTTPGPYPVIIYLPGFSGVVSATYYTTLMTTITEQNLIIIGISKIESVKPEEVAQHIQDFLNWVVTPDGAKKLFLDHKKVKDVIPDVERLAFLTHSSAGHPLGQYLNSTCGPVKVIVMMNPVDGIDPFGHAQDFITHPPNPLPFRLPTLIISAGLDNVSVIPDGPPCAPIQRHFGDYNTAKFWIQKAIELEPVNVDVRREEKTIKMKYERIPVNEALNLNSRSLNLDEQRPWYNILSIDGDGIRGMIPAIWLMELERKIRQPISSIFHVVADILMCTTAAPTYFPGYRLKNSVYVDVQTNNPAMIAYNHTLNLYPNCDRNRIRLLSLGTSDYV
ncbi:unnamed protein product [Didymodactylos carnosus]|uniref:Chlorophyllase n=1 Tax=Didymodactylos carnosus TaxID=1234261 RepID=A0A814WIR2_9BILA|nr:unnamed protein product [Didymodactylos carnosus]CAF3963636.1 unnamed protein product [Didymodactylos carnosus]